MAVHCWCRVGSEEDEDKADRDLNLHQVRHHDGMGKSNEANKRFIEAVKSSDHGHCALSSGQQLALDVVPLLCVMMLGQIF